MSQALREVSARVRKMHKVQTLSNEAAAVFNEALALRCLRTDVQWVATDAAKILYNVKKTGSPRPLWTALCHRLLPAIVHEIRRGGDGGIMMPQRKVFMNPSEFLSAVRLSEACDVVSVEKDSKARRKKDITHTVGKLLTVDGIRVTTRDQAVKLLKKLTRAELSFGTYASNVIDGRELSLLLWCLADQPERSTAPGVVFHPPSSFATGREILRGREFRVACGMAPDGQDTFAQVAAKQLLTEAHKRHVFSSLDDVCLSLWAGIRLALQREDLSWLLSHGASLLDTLVDNHDRQHPLSRVSRPLRTADSQKSHPSKATASPVPPTNRDSATYASRLLWSAAKLSAVDSLETFESCERALLRVDVHGGWVSTKYYANALWALASLKAMQVDLIRHLTSDLPRGGFTEEGLSAVLWSVTTLEVVNCTELVAKAGEKIRKGEVKDNAEKHALGSYVWAASMCFVTPPQWIVEEVTRCVTRGSVDFVSRVLAAAPGLQWGDGVLIEGAMSRFEELWTGMSFRDVSKCLVSYAKLSLPAPLAAYNMCEQLVAQLPPVTAPRAFISCAWSVASLRVLSRPFFRAIATHVVRVSRTACLFPIDGIQLLWCFATVSAKVKPSLLTVLLQSFIELPHDTSPLDLVMLAHSLSLAAVSDHRVLDLVLNEVSAKEPELSPSNALSLLSSLTRLGVPADSFVVNMLHGKTVEGLTVQPSSDLLYHANRGFNMKRSFECNFA
ncbi:hypothetical protein DIPPA_00314 [Diplonema papillatum]|nr:hypothetical protein DIPPA_00314 [Diplonema papillatum]